MISELSTKENLTAALGGKGFDIITGTETGKWCAVCPIDGASATITATTVSGDSIIPLEIYGIIYGDFNEITAVTGKLIAYRY